MDVYTTLVTCPLTCRSPIIHPPGQELCAAMRDIFPRSHAHPNYRGRFVLVQYLLLAGVNDSEGDAARLAELLAGVRCKINVLEFNPHPGTPFRRSQAAACFLEALRRRGHVATLRVSRGGEHMAACGQLGELGRRGETGAPLEPLPRLTRPPAQFSDRLAPPWPA